MSASKAACGTECFTCAPYAFFARVCRQMLLSSSGAASDYSAGSTNDFARGLGLRGIASGRMHVKTQVELNEITFDFSDNVDSQRLRGWH